MKKFKEIFSKKILYIIGFVLAAIMILVMSGYLLLRNSESIKDSFSFLFNSKSTSQDSDKLIVSESEANTIKIVGDSQASVVSIAISTLSVSKTEGVVDNSNSIGTGFIIDSSGLILTNQHVVSSDKAVYQVITNDEKKYDVVEIIKDDVNDIALIKIDAKDLTPIKLGNSDILAVGQKVLAIGTPLGKYAGSATEGIISGLDRTVTASSDWSGFTSKTYEDVIQTDAAVNPGNSGGPLINSQGEVIGINFATTSGADNISFAIPINKVKERVEEYKTYGKFIKPYMGISYEMFYEYDLLYYTNIVPGALIRGLDTTGPAYNAGIRRGDIVTKFGGESVNIALINLIQKHKVGESVKVEIYRNGSTKNFDVVLGEVE